MTTSKIRRVLWTMMTYLSTIAIVYIYMQHKTEEQTTYCFGEYTYVRDPSLPVIITPASANHFRESEGLLKSIQTVLYPKYGKFKIIYMDLGLFKEQRTVLEKYCHCEVRKFPFTNYPDHVQSLQSFAWKPILIMEMLKEFGYIMYVDTSVRFREPADLLDNLFKKTADPETPVITKEGYGSIMIRTMMHTWEAMHEDPLKFKDRPEVEANFVMARMTPFSMKYIIEPWVTCALQFGCMTNGEIAGTCPRDDLVQVGRCHRFDQSVLGIILNKVYNGNYSKFTTNLVDVKRGSYDLFFPKR